MMNLEVYKLDRIEEDFAVLESPSGKMISVPKNLLPKNAKDGDCFSYDDKNFTFSEEETNRRKKAVFDILSGLISKN
ncbi:MAG: DUF3006 domain-containing protein [Oscillospiraceae bacterium]|nr:DUF3006 domain-containing protein [Oscillospiraceae bacterium]